MYSKFAKIKTRQIYANLLSNLRLFAFGCIGLSILHLFFRNYVFDQRIFWCCFDFAIILIIIGVFDLIEYLMQDNQRLNKENTAKHQEYHEKVEENHVLRKQIIMLEETLNISNEQLKELTFRNYAVQNLQNEQLSSESPVKEDVSKSSNNDQEQIQQSIESLNVEISESQNIPFSQKPSQSCVSYSIIDEDKASSKQTSSPTNFSSSCHSRSYLQKMNDCGVFKPQIKRQPKPTEDFSKREKAISSPSSSLSTFNKNLAATPTSSRIRNDAFKSSIFDFENVIDSENGKNIKKCESNTVYEKQGNDGRKFKKPKHKKPVSSTSKSTFDKCDESSNSLNSSVKYSAEHITFKTKKKASDTFNENLCESSNILISSEMSMPSSNEKFVDDTEKLPPPSVAVLNQTYILSSTVPNEMITPIHVKSSKQKHCKSPPPIPPKPSTFSKSLVATPTTSSNIYKFATPNLPNNNALLSEMHENVRFKNINICKFDSEKENVDNKELEKERQQEVQANQNFQSIPQAPPLPANLSFNKKINTSSTSVTNVNTPSKTLNGRSLPAEIKDALRGRRKDINGENSDEEEIQEQPSIQIISTSTPPPAPPLPSNLNETISITPTSSKIKPSEISANSERKTPMNNTLLAEIRAGFKLTPIPAKKDGKSDQRNDFSTSLLKTFDEKFPQKLDDYKNKENENDGEWLN
uniref:WH2 domain-containing protein n=1 Tax=Panagrolaimus sp. ES5 TaxID=591445 RepID=A0AC34GT45_9BILA